ncbi:protein FAM227A isoform X2 [Dermochelys coriacea]|uniref:protein FAM227A isoform X2 n=1 Tax=Dermochelys coriacea TaxID=27794 RepID=UPI001CA87DDE|nr:protein FAM227A isoform X2 [Dermochelys coriacea]
MQGFNSEIAKKSTSIFPAPSSSLLFSGIIITVTIESKMFNFRTPFLTPVEVLKSAMLIDPSALKHLSTAPLSSCSKPQNTSEKNKLVELYQYPGYNEHEPTPLPNGTELTDIIEKVVCAQRKSASGKTPFPSKMLQKFLTAPVSHAILLDSFWWFFLHLYQPNREIQGQLFDRIAKNYAALMFDCHKFRYQNALIKVFPSLLSQTLYTCFCSSFPRSWFDTHEFKSQLCNVLSEWMAGTLPVPGSYSSWDYSNLEPERFRREDLLSTKGKQRTESSVPFASSKASSNPEKTPQPSIQPYKKRMSLGQTVNKHQPDQTSLDLGSKEVVHASMSFKGITPHTMPHDLQPEKDDLKSAWKQPQHTFKTRRLKIAPLHRESHPACQGPNFTWHLFNINGHSPLIQHFLQSYNVEPQSGQDILIHRREICKPIPTESTPTYADVIRQGFNHIRHLDDAFKTMRQRHCREMKDFDQHQWKKKQEFLRNKNEKEKQLLSEKGEKLNQLLTPHLDVLNSSDKSSSLSQKCLNPETAISQQHPEQTRIHDSPNINVHSDLHMHLNGIFWAGHPKAFSIN